MNEPKNENSGLEDLERLFRESVEGLTGRGIPVETQKRKGRRPKSRKASRTAPKGADDQRKAKRKAARKARKRSRRCAR